MSPTTASFTGLGAEGAAAVRLAGVHGHERAALQLGEVGAGGSRRLAESGQAEVHRLREQPARSSAGTSRLGLWAFLLMHVACLAIFLTGTNVLALALCAACYFIQMVGITAGLMEATSKVGPVDWAGV